MNKKILVSAIIIITALTSKAFTQKLSAQNYYDDRTYIEVTGKSELKIKPDIIYMSIQLNESDFKNKSLEEIESKMFKGLKSLGIDLEKQLTVNDLASNYKKYFLRGKDPVISKSYQLLVHSAASTGRVIAKLQDLDISKISITKIDNSKMEEYKNKAGVMAIKNAKIKAESLAGAIGQKVLEAYSITDYGVTSSNNRNRNVMMLTRAKTNSSLEEATPELEFQDIIITYSVGVKFRLF
ncbi:MAG: SIMPL domain-containing protein [Bacteroidales bacterium]